MTDYYLNDNELEECILFCAAVAGKNALTTAKILDVFLQGLMDDCATFLDFYGSPFELIKCENKEDLALRLKSVGMGCYNQRAKTFLSLANSGYNLKTCSVKDLEKISGIGPKTSRFFVLHTRPNVQVAVLDTHILSFLSEKGYDVPKTTPVGKRYLEIEKIWLNLARKSGKTLAEYDLEIWNSRRKSN